MAEGADCIQITDSNNKSVFNTSNLNEFFAKCRELKDRIDLYEFLRHSLFGEGPYSFDPDGNGKLNFRWRGTYTGYIHLIGALSEYGVGLYKVSYEDYLSIAKKAESFPYYSTRDDPGHLYPKNWTFEGYDRDKICLNQSQKQCLLDSHKPFHTAVMYTLKYRNLRNDYVNVSAYDSVTGDNTNASGHIDRKLPQLTFHVSETYNRINRTARKATLNYSDDAWMDRLFYDSGVYCSLPSDNIDDG